MTPERWQLARRVLSGALERDPAEREKYLADACTGDEALRNEVEQLLSAHGHAGKFLETPVLHAAGQVVMHLDAGTQLGPYEIVAAIGAGGMGEVYRAHDSRLERTVAIKILSGAGIHDSEQRQRFLQEARAASALSHPNIVTLHDIGSDSGIDFFVMEYVPETPLDRLISGKPMPLAEVLDYGIQIANALAAAHAAGIIHRDIKPANVMVTPQRQVKVLDFGLAKWPESGGAGPESKTQTTHLSLTQAGQVMGTVAYMSPEQARGERVDARTDWFSFGAVLYEMATGRRAFSQLRDWTPPPANGVDPSLYRIILKLVHVDREQRYASANNVVLDLKRLQQAVQSSQARRRRLVFTSALVALLLIAVGVGFYYATKRPVTSPSEYIQLTNFTDSVSAPSLSPDGRMVTFKRGGDFFLSPGQIYVKSLPNGESVRLTNDANAKYGPVFTPDGSRVAYTRLGGSGSSLSWDTWTVLITGGEPTPFLPNASGLTWISRQRIMFSEIMTGLHMGVVTATETRADSRTIYFPAHELGMAHYSYTSPDLKSILVVEMGATHSWDSPCRLLSFDGISAGRQVGPRGKCLSAAWSPDGKWMYFGADVGGNVHLWRQKFPDGTPEQITFGPTQEEGIAVAPDGGSLITSVGRRTSGLWIHDADGERAVTSEGYASSPQLTHDGKAVFYVDSGLSTAFSGAGPAPVGELRRVDLTTGKTDAVLPGIPVSDYDISRDEKEIVFTTLNGGEPEIWLAPLDRRSAPRKVTQPGDQVSFGSGQELVFRVREKQANFLYRVNSDGSKREQITKRPISYKYGVSPDGEWVTATVPIDGNGSTDAVTVPVETVVVPVHGGVFKKISTDDSSAMWSPNGRFFYMTQGKWQAIALAAGQMLPNLTDTGISPSVHGVPLNAVDTSQGHSLAPGPDPSMYVFQKTEIRSNLFRIPLH
jgi:serine/threonine protein kinase